MFLSTLKRGAALTVTAAMLAGVAASAASAAPRAMTRPSAQGLSPNVNGSHQVLSEGGTLAAYFIANLMDILGVPIACSGTSFDRDCAAESNLPARAPTNPQYLYAATGTGGAQLDFVSQKTGVAGKTAQSPAPVFADALDSYSNTSPVGYVTGWAGAAASSTAEDTIHFAAGDAPIPLGPAENSDYVPSGFTEYADSLAAFNNDGHPNGSGYNHNRGPALVQPIIGTGVSIIFNNTGLSIPAGGLNLTQDDLCGIFTGVYTNWNQTSANPGNEAITIVHRSDGSGTTFLFAYDMSKMCSSANPAIAAGLAGAPTSAHFWGSPTNLRTQGVGTDSNNIVGTTIPTDSSAPEVVWPASSSGQSKSSGVLSYITATAGTIGYISPAYATSSTVSEANVENYEGGYEPATSTTVGASLSTFVKGTSPEPNPPGYPKATNTSALYFPFPTSSTGDALVGFSYAYFYKCAPTRQALQLAAIKKLFEYETNSSTSGTAAAVAAFWNLNGLPSGELSLLANTVENLKSGPVTNGTYFNPVTGAKQTFSCTAN
jgi:ABC-type phosphate transport system substrate-binding protein